MSRDVQARAFEPFYTTKDIGHGTGLGLSQVYGFVKQSGGHVKLYSEEGMGTTVKLYLPRQHADADVAPEPSVAGFAPRSLTGECILVVEDDDDVRAHSTGILRELGYTVLEAGDGEEGLRAAREFHGRIDALLTDLVMPRMGGADLARVLSVERPNLRVLFASGYAAELRRQEPGPGFETAFLGKPFEPTDVTRSLRELLDRRPQARTLE